MTNLSFNKIVASALILIGVGLTSATQAADISHSLRNQTGNSPESENYFEIGIGAATGVAPSLTEDKAQWATMFVFINGSYNWRGLFVERYSSASDPMLFGYNAYNSDNWSFDIIVAPKYGCNLCNKRFDKLNARDSSTMFGGRLTGYVGDNILQFSVKKDIRGTSDGLEASAIIGQNWQYRNWNIHGMLGLKYYDANINDYYYGVSAEEAARTDFAEYHPNSNVNFWAETGVSYPLSENWVFRATARASTVSSEDTDSPLFLTTRSTRLSLSTSVSYVF